MLSEGYCTWSVCLCVCVFLSVYDYSCTTGNEAESERYQQHQCNKRSKTKMAILLKRRRSRSRNWHYRGPCCVTQPHQLVVSACVRTTILRARARHIAPRPEAIMPEFILIILSCTSLHYHPIILSFMPIILLLFPSKINITACFIATCYSLVKHIPAVH